MLFVATMLAATAALVAQSPSGDNMPPSLTHVPFKEVMARHPVRFEVEIIDDSVVFEPRITWRLAGGEWRMLPLTRSGGDRFVADLPGEEVTGNIEYYVEAYDEHGNGPGRSGTPQKPHLLSVAAPDGPQIILAQVVEAPPDALAGNAEPAPAPPAAPEQPSALAPWIALAAGAVVAVTGAVMWSSASADASDLNARFPAKGTSLAAADHDLAQGAISRGQIGSALIIAGAVGMAASAGWLFVPSAGSGSMSLTLGGSF